MTLSRRHLEAGMPMHSMDLSVVGDERSAACYTIKLNPEPTKEYLTSKVVLMQKK